MKVEAGDSLWKISRRTGIPVQRLVELNHIQDPNKIRAGMELRLGNEGPNLASILYQQPPQPTAARHEMRALGEDNMDARRAQFASDVSRAMFEPMIGGLGAGAASRWIKPSLAASRGPSGPSNDGPPIGSMDAGYVHPYNGPVGGGSVPEGTLRTLDERFSPTNQQGWRDLIEENPTLAAMYQRYPK